MKLTIEFENAAEQLKVFPDNDFQRAVLDRLIRLFNVFIRRSGLELKDVEVKNRDIA